MNKMWYLYTGALTLFTIFTIQKYEKQIEDHKGSIEDYRRALGIAKNHNTTEHTTYLQLENSKLNKEIQRLRSAAIYEAKHMENLSKDNDALQMQIKTLKEQLAGDQRIQYESHVYKNSQWESNLDYKDTEKIVEL
jgi:regulator of replication initiation timing